MLNAAYSEAKQPTKKDGKVTTHKPLITIGITCFNAEDTIIRAINSAQKQDWDNYEILIVDDASDDASVKVIETAQKQDERIRLHKHSENLGYPSALNTIVKNAKGEYIAFIDDDDDHQADRITKQYRKISDFEQAHPDTPVLCYTHRKVCIDGIEKPESFVTAIGHCAPEPHGSMVADYVLWHKKEKGYSWGEFGSCTMIAPKKTLEEFGFDPNFRRCAEWDLAIRIALKGGYFISVDEALVIQHKTQTADKAGRKPLDYTLMLRKKHKAYLQKNHVYLGATLQAYARFYHFRNKYWKSRFCLALACLTSPTKILLDEVERRILKR